MLRLKFPRLITAPNSRGVLSLCNQAIKSRQSPLLFDLSDAQFVTPFGATVLSGTITTCIEQGKDIRYQKPQNEDVDEWLSSISFSGFFHIDERSARARATSIQLRQLKGLNPVFVDDLLGLLDNNMNLSEGVRDSIQLSLYELLINVFDHSKSDIGCFVCAQFTPKSQFYVNPAP
jgi:hypothetical protein